MADTSQDRCVQKRCTRRMKDPLASDALIPAGGMYVLDKDGYATPATADHKGYVRGVALRRADAAAGDTAVHGACDCFLFENDGSITRAHIRTTNAKVVDCHTAGASGGCTAGRIVDVCEQGVWVHVGTRKM